MTAKTLVRRLSLSMILALWAGNSWAVARERVEPPAIATFSPEEALWLLTTPTL